LKRADCELTGFLVLRCHPEIRAVSLPAVAGGQPEESVVDSRQLPLNSLCGSCLPAVAGLQLRHKMPFKNSFPFGGILAEPFLFLVFFSLFSFPCFLFLVFFSLFSFPCFP
jgi:hypothetical protein